MGTALAPLDALRLSFFRLLGPLGGRLARDRELRVGLTLAGWVLVAFTLSSLVPIWMLALGPILLGVPHVLGDVRYLVVRRGLHRRAGIVVLAGIPLLVAATIGGLLAALVGAGGALVASRASPRRKLGGLALLSPLIALSATYPLEADLVFAHGHNLVGVTLFWLWRPRRGAAHLLALLAFGVACGLILAGATTPLLMAAGDLSAFANVQPDALAWSLAPGVEGPWALRLLLLFAFAQSVHYLVWVRLMPEEDRGRDTVRTFGASWESLVSDLGLWLVAGAALVALAIAIWAVADLAAARYGYLRMALFHGQLELVALALLFAEGREYSMGSGVRAT
jgi:hypothetical protein